MHLLLLMSGEGKRFSEKGYTQPKPLIQMPYGENKEIMPMYHAVIKNCLEQFPIHKITMITRKEHNINKKDMVHLLDKQIPVHIIEVEKTTGGALESALLAEPLMNGADELLIVNSDQLIKIDQLNFDTLYKQFHISENIIFTFKPNDNSSKWSFAELNDDNVVKRVAEKVKISDIATCGLYYFGTEWEFISASDKQIEANDRFNGEFYLCPVYNYVSEDTICFNVSEMMGLGTPEDMDEYINSEGWKKF